MVFRVFSRSDINHKIINMQQLIQKGSLLSLAFFLTITGFAQDKKVDVDIDVNKGDSNWYQQPWVWIVGGAVFVLLLVAILKGSGRKDA
jgi:hypothetical protein